MSRRKWGPDDEDYFETTLAYIVEIRKIAHPLMCTLAAHFYSDHFPPQRRGNIGSISEAKETWNRDPRFIDSDRGGGGAQKDAGGDDGIEAEFEQDVPDVEAVLDEVLQSDAQDYNATKADMFDRHMRATQIVAQCLVRFLDGNSGVWKHALVRGKWWTLSASVPLCVRGKKVFRSQLERRMSGADAELDLIDASVFGGAIFMPKVPHVSGAQFYHLMIENGNFAPAEAREHLVAVFAEPSEDDEIRAMSRDADDESGGGGGDADDGSTDSLGIPHQPRNGGEGMRVAVTYREMRHQQSAIVNQQRIAVHGVTTRLLAPSEVQERCKRLCSKDVQRQMQRAPFIALGLRALLQYDEYFFIEQCYGASVQIEALARGPQFTAALAQLLSNEPWVLSIYQLRCEFAAESHIGGLRQLPDLSCDKFIELLQHFDIDCDMGVRAGVDLYHNVLRRDVYGYDTQREARSADGAFSYTSGHMFSVFGADRSHHLPHYYHAHGRPDTGTALHDPDSFAHAGLFALPWATTTTTTAAAAQSDESGRGDDGAIAGQKVTQPDADEIDFVAAALALPIDVRDNMRLDLNRMRYAPARNFAAVMRGLHWLLSKRVVVVERFVGNGPHNSGRLVDAFFLTQVHEAQCSLVRRLTDMSTRALYHARWSPHDSVVDARTQRLFSEIVRAEEHWRKEYTPAVMALNKMQRNAATGLASDTALHARDAATQAAPVDDNLVPLQTPIGALARQIASEEAKFAERYDDVRAERARSAVAAGGVSERIALEDRAYAEVRAASELGAHRTWPLLRVAKFSRRLPNKQRLAREQIAALERVQKLPLVQISGPGGVGKSELIAQICAQYPPEQVVLTAFTGQVASELARRTQRQARTIHSLLFMHARYLKARFRARAFARARVAKREADGVPDPRTLTADQMRKVTDVRELREYVEHHCASQPPFASPFQHARVLVVDEISLVAFPLFCRLIEAAHAPEQGRFLQKLVLVGDLNQLPPIGFGSIQADMAHGLPHSVSQLVVNHRSSGTQLFRLAQEIARHEPELTMPAFSRGGAHAALSEPRDNDIVAYEMADLAEDLRNVYEEIGADHAHSDVALSTQCLAATNATVNSANAIVREMYFVDPQLDGMRAQLERAAGIGSGAMVQANSAAQAARRAKISSQLADEREKLLRTLPMKLYRFDRFFVRANQRLVVRALHEHEEHAVIEFFNGRLLLVMQFYDAPRRIEKKTYCRCRLCPAPAEGAASDALGECMRDRSVPPPARCAQPRPEDHAAGIVFHDYKKPPRRDPKRRMVVARNVSSGDAKLSDEVQPRNHVELDVDRMLVPRSKFGHGFALTVHKMQGSQARFIVFVCASNAPYITWEHIYTAVTRARERVVIMSEAHTFHQLVRRKAPVRRSNLWLHLHRALSNVSAHLEPRSSWRTPREWLACKRPMSDYPRWPEPVNRDAQQAWCAFEELRQAGAAATGAADEEDEEDEEEEDEEEAAADEAAANEEDAELELAMVRAAEEAERATRADAAPSTKRKKPQKKRAPAAWIARLTSAPAAKKKRSK